MHEQDLWLEDRLRTVLRDEAASLSFTLTVADLEGRLAERGRRRTLPLPLAWAAVIVVAVASLAVATGLPDSLVGPVRPSPTPNASPSATPDLPTLDALMAKAPEATLLLEGRRVAGPTASSTPAPDDRYVLGRFSPSQPFVVVAACVGADVVTVEVGDLGGVGTYVSTPVRCGGEVSLSPSTTSVGGEDLPVTVTAPAGASWAVAVGEYPAAFAEGPVLPALEITPGWSLLVGSPDDTTMVQPGAGTGLGLTVPPAATRVAVWVTCSGELPATITLGSATAEVDCPSMATERLEVPADPSGQTSARVTSEGRMWARLVAEIDTGLEITYPSAPPLPPDVAAATWAATGTQNLTVGWIGGNTARLVAFPSHQAGIARGDHVVVAVGEEDGSGRIDLVSVPSAAVERTILDSDRFVQEVWFDATHESVVYVVGTGATIEFRSVRLDGSGDRRLIETPVADPADPLYSLSRGLAYDDSVFVVETCRAAGCERTIVDQASGDLRTIDTTEAPVCGMIGIIDGLVVGRYRAGCARDDSAPVSVVVSPLDGGPSRTLDAVGDADGIVIPTLDGPRAILLLEMGEDLSQTIVAVDPTSGAMSTIYENPDGSSAFVGPVPVRLPDGYVLLASSLSDDPPSRGFIVRAVPLLVNIDTGETTELPNLPHTLGGTP